jgi:hypothetical protein
MKCVRVTIYTDPGCPFGFRAQRQETQLTWHYRETRRHRHTGESGLPRLSRHRSGAL